MSPAPIAPAPEMEAAPPAANAAAAEIEAPLEAEQ